MGASRREFLRFGVWSIANAFTIARPATAETLANLGQIAAAKGIRFGSAFDREVLNDRPYAQLIARLCQTAAVENSLKFDWLKPNGPSADFTLADQLIAFTQINQLAPRGTALIWNEWTPKWLDRLDVREIEAEFDRHISSVVSRYAGRIWAWDVVNEPFFPLHGRPGGYRKGVWFDALGPAYVPRAFRAAAKADPHAHLILNEAFCEQNDDWGNAVRPRLLELTRRLKGEGVPLHGVGFQGHLKPHLPYDYDRFVDFAQAVGELGLDVHITELDVDDSSLPDNTEQRDRAVADQLTKFLTPMLRAPSLRSVTAWHLSDKYSWYADVGEYPIAIAKAGGNPKRPPRTHFLDASFQEKASWRAITNAFFNVH